MTSVMDRDQTLEFLRQHVKTDTLMKHLYTVDTAGTIVYTPGQKSESRCRYDNCPGSAGGAAARY